jgi:hypothetical protein
VKWIRLFCTQELVNQMSFMGREVIENNVNLLLGRALRGDFFEKGNEILAGVASCGFAVNTARGCFLARHTVTAFRGDSTRNHGARSALARAAKRDRVGPEPESQSFH